MKPVIDLGKPKIQLVDPNTIHHLLNPGELGAVLEWVVHDPLTGEVAEHKVRKSESFVQQFLQLLYVKMALSHFTAPVSIRDTSNVLKNIYDNPAIGPANLTFDMTAAATVVTYGIIVGTGVVAPTISDFAIGTLIPHATMNYSAMTFGAPAADATTSQITITRNFANVSGAPVTVNEVALYCRATDTGGATIFLMLIRDVIAGGIAVPNGQTLTVNYRPQVVV